MKFWDSFSLCKIQEPAWLQLDHKKFKPSEVRCSGPYIKKLKKHALVSHVLVHFLKSTKAYNVKSSSTLFLDNILSNFEISFPCVRFNSLLGNNLIRKSWDHQKLDFHTPISRDWKNTLSCEIYVFEKLWIANLLNSKPIKMDEKIKHLYLQTF